MKKPKIFILLFFIIFILSTVYSSDPVKDPVKAKFRLGLDFHADPFFYEPSCIIYGSSFNGSLMAGIVLNQFTLGFELSESFVNMVGPSTNILTGAYNILRGTVNAYYKPLNWLELKWGVGGSWLINSFAYLKKKAFHNSAGGISVLFNMSFKPLKYMDIDFVNSIDFIINSDPIYNVLEPYYYGGLRLVVHPYVPWMSLYAEAGVMPWFYKTDSFDLKTAMFTWSLGISTDMTFPDSFQKKKIDKTTIIINKDDAAYKEIKSDLIKLDQLNLAKDGESIKFYKIKLTENASDIRDDSKVLLGEIGKILAIKSNFNLEIRVHTNNTENAAADIQRSKEKAEMIKFFLIKEMKISSEKITTFGFGSLYDKYYKKNDVEGYVDCVEFRFLSKNDIYNESSLNQLRNMGKDTVIPMNGIYFRKNTAELLNDSIQYMEKIIVILTERSNLTFSIQGYADYTGDAFTDLKNAAIRANVIKQYLTDYGITPSRIKVSASGKIYSVETIVNQAFIEFKILN